MPAPVVSRRSGRAVARAIATLVVTAAVVGLLAFGFGGGCFSERSSRAVQESGGHWVPTGEGPLVRQRPVDSISFKATPRPLDDAAFAAVFPHVRSMDPQRLWLEGQPLTDATVPLLNDLRSVTTIGLEETDVTAAGLRRLRPRRPLVVRVSAERVTDAEAAGVEAAVPKLTIQRWPIAPSRPVPPTEAPAAP